MTMPPVAQNEREADAAKCLARSVVDTLAEEPALEAVTIDTAQQKISVATLGRADVEKLTAKISAKISSARLPRMALTP